MAEYEARFTAELDNGHVAGDVVFPSSVKLEATGLKGAPDVEAVFEMRDGVPEVVDFRITAKANGRAVRSADLDSFMPLERFAIAGFRRFSSRRDGRGSERPNGNLGPADSREFWDVTGTLHAARESRTGPSHAELEEVARIYREAVQGRPTEAVQIQGGYPSRRTAARRIQQARAAGLLPKTSPGKKNA